MSGSGLTGIYSQILSFFPKQCSLLLELTHPRPPPSGGTTSGVGSPRVPGFNFLVNAVWPEVVAVVEERIPAIFAPGNPDNFHKVLCVFVCLCLFMLGVSTHSFAMHSGVCVFVLHVSSLNPLVLPCIIALQ